MIFVTVGTQLAFNRLIRAMDGWAASNPGVEVCAQIGPDAESPKAMAHAAFLPAAELTALVRRAELIVSHAGMGSVLTALRHQRPILILPRRAALGEHRNDHQVATARWLLGRPGVEVAWDETEIEKKLDRRHLAAAGPELPEYASGPLVERLAAYLGSVR